MRSIFVCVVCVCVCGTTLVTESRYLNMLCAFLSLQGLCDKQNLTFLSFIMKFMELVG